MINFDHTNLTPLAIVKNSFQFQINMWEQTTLVINMCTGPIYLSWSRRQKIQLLGFIGYESHSINKPSLSCHYLHCIQKLHDLYLILQVNLRLSYMIALILLRKNDQEALELKKLSRLNRSVIKSDINWHL